MSNGRIIPPNLDDRTWQDIVDQTLALKRKYVPEWTDNPSDLGNTLIEMWAWIVEGLIFRLNATPEKNFDEFLNLIGITREPATPARADLTFKVSGAAPVLIPRGTQVATPQTETKEAVVFEIDEDLNVLPANLTHCLVALEISSRYDYPYYNRTNHLVTGPLQEVVVVVLPRKSAVLYLGFDSPIADPIRINFRFKRGIPEGSAEIAASYYQGSWTSLTRVEDQTGSFNRNGKIVVQIPPDWQTSRPSDWGFVSPAPPEDEVTHSRFWIDVTVNNLERYPLSFVLESITVNSVSAANALTVNINEADAQAEPLGTSNGKRFQLVTLKNTPLYKKPSVKDPYKHLKIQVREPAGGGFGTWEEWERVENIPQGEGKYFRCHPVTVEIMFGNHEPATGAGNGRIPPQGSEIRALTYRYVVGGTKGNVPEHSINVVRSPVPAVVNNPGAPTGGFDQESVEETKRKGPEVLKNRLRFVTVEDGEFLAKEASADLSKVRCLPPRLFTNDERLLPGFTGVGDPWLYANLNRSPGRINVIIVPFEPETFARPKPDEGLILEVADYLNDRRVATVLLHVSGPKYLPIDVEAKLVVWQRAIDNGLIADAAEVQTQITENINKFLHPLVGNTDGKGWEVGQHIFIADLFDYIVPNTDIGYIERLDIKAAVPDYHDPSLPWNPDERPYPINVLTVFPINILNVWIQLTDYELVCNGVHTVNTNVVVS